MKEAGAGERILIVRLSHLGDICHALPVYHALRRTRPGARLAWIVQGEFAPLVEMLPGIERVIRFDRRGGLGAWLRARREMRSFDPTWTIDCQGNMKSGAATRLSGAPRRTGLHPEEWRETLGARALTDPAPPPYGRHAIHRMQSIIECIDFGGEDPDITLPLSDDARDAGRSALEQRLPDRGRRRRVLHLGRAGDPRSWPIEHVTVCARTLAEAGEDILLIAGPAELELGQRLAFQLGGVDGIFHWHDQGGLPELAAFLAATAEARIRVIAGDSGPCHLAAATGCAVDLIVGSQDPELTGPWPSAMGQKSPHRLHRAPTGDRIEDVDPRAVTGRLLNEDA
jgi:heptosyltransferase I